MKQVVLRQYDNPDCTLGQVMNCAIRNNPEFAKVFTQNLLDKYMPEYWGKTTREAFYFLKEKGHNLRLLQFSFASAKVHLRKGRTIAGGLRYTQGWWQDYIDDRIVNGSKDMTVRTKGHAFVLQPKDGKIYAIDSNFDRPYEIDWELFVREKIIKGTFYYIH